MPSEPPLIAPAAIPAGPAAIPITAPVTVPSTAPPTSKIQHGGPPDREPSSAPVFRDSEMPSYSY